MLRFPGRNTVIAAVVFAAIPLAIMGAAVLCAWAVTHGASQSWKVPFLLLCHGIPARCYRLWGTPLPVCARCTGIYAGLFGGLATFFLVPSIAERRVRIVCIAATVVLAVDGLTQLAHLRESTNDLRLATGLACGWTFGMWVLSAMERRGDVQTNLP